MRPILSISNAHKGVIKIAVDHRTRLTVQTR